MDLNPPPPPPPGSISSISDTTEDLRKRDNLLTGGEGEGVGEKPNQMTARKPVQYKLSNTLLVTPSIKPAGGVVGLGLQQAKPWL